MYGDLPTAAGLSAGLRDATAHLSPTYKATYLTTALPDDTDEALRRIVERVQTLPPSEQMRFASAVREPDAEVLGLFAERMATLAVRKRDSGSALTGLSAISLTNDAADQRELLPVVAMLYRAVERLDADPTSLFERAALPFTSNIAEEIRTFPRRDPSHRGLASMGYEERIVEGQFHFYPTERDRHPTLESTKVFKLMRDRRTPGGP